MYSLLLIYCLWEENNWGMPQYIFHRICHRMYVTGSFISFCETEDISQVYILFVSEKKVILLANVAFSRHNIMANLF